MDSPYLNNCLVYGKMTNCTICYLFILFLFVIIFYSGVLTYENNLRENYTSLSKFLILTLVLKTHAHTSGETDRAIQSVTFSDLKKSQIQLSDRETNPRISFYFVTSLLVFFLLFLFSKSTIFMYVKTTVRVTSVTISSP